MNLPTGRKSGPACKMSPPETKNDNDIRYSYMHNSIFGIDIWIFGYRYLVDSKYNTNLFFYRKEHEKRHL